jgi:hypothetical protein
MGLLAVLGMLLVLAGCGGGSPATFESVPRFPDSSELEAGSNQMADMMIDTMNSSIGDKATAVTKAYTIPGDADWEAIKQFYTDQLASTDWKPASDMDAESEVLNVVGWQRGSLASEQVLMVGYMPALLGNEPVLLVSLFSE